MTPFPELASYRFLTPIYKSGRVALDPIPARDLRPIALVMVRGATSARA